VAVGMIYAGTPILHPHLGATMVSIGYARWICRSCSNLVKCVRCCQI